MLSDRNRIDERAMNFVVAKPNRISMMMIVMFFFFFTLDVVFENCV